MFNNNKSLLEKLRAEVLVNVASFLDLASILQLSLTAKSFCHLIKDELLFKYLSERDHHVTEKSSEQTWLNIYKQLNVKDVTMTEASNVQQIDENETTQAYSEEIATNPDQPITTVSESTNQSTEETMTDACPHFVKLADIPREVKRIIFKSEESYPCDLCLEKPATYLNMHYDDHTGG